MDIEVVACGVAVAHDGTACHHLRLAAGHWRQLIQILLVFGHFHQFSLSLKLCHFGRSVSKLFELLLLSHSTLTLDCLSIVLLVELPIQLLPIMFALVFESALFCFPPLLASLLFFFYSALDVFFLERVSFLVEVGVVLGDIVLVVGEHLVVLRVMAVTFL
jgi:hypothetical protein